MARMLRGETADGEVDSEDDDEGYGAATATATATATAAAPGSGAGVGEGEEGLINLKTISILASQPNTAVFCV